MLKRSGYSLFIILILGYPAFSLLKPSTVTADINSCQASMFAHVVSPHSGNSFTIHITNTGSSNIESIRITRPSTNFTILDNSAPGWTDSTTAEFANESDGIITPGDNLDVTIDVQTANVQAGPADWTISVTDASSSSFACDGSLGMAISGDLSDLTPPNIFNVLASAISTTSVNISWSTDEASDSEVNYGRFSSYGNSTDLNSDLTTDHSLSLSGLTPGTGYHFQVVSSDSSGNTSGSSDNTFLTSPAPVAKSNNSLRADAPLNSVIPIKVVPSEHVAPTIQLVVPVGKSFAVAPLITGSAQDNEALAGIEYSTDNGKNWLPIDSYSPLGGKTASFAFTPLNLAEGNYKILARAIDTSGNIGMTPVVELVIDRLPPQIGGIVMSLGPQVLQSRNGGEISVLAGVDEKITLSAIGGPTDINLEALGADLKNTGKSFSLTQSPASGLWSGVLSFGKAGSYKLVAIARDGAGNRTTKLLDTVNVIQPAKVVAKNGQPVSATITAYYLEPESNQWVVWDANAYGQANPQSTTTQGVFNLYLPAGTYYLKAKAMGYATITSSIFKLNIPSPVVPVLTASKAFGLLRFGGLGFSIQPVEVKPKPSQPYPNSAANLVGQQLPDFKLVNTQGQTVNAASLLGRPTILSFMSTWAPATSEQLPALNKIAANKDINVVPVALQQTLGEAGAYQAISGYDLTWLADPDSSTSADFSVSNLPTHYFIDRNGTVKKIITGVVSKQQLLNIISGL